MTLKTTMLIRNLLLTANMVVWLVAVRAQPVRPIVNRAPLAPTPYVELPLGAIEPTGWLRQQLVIMNNGATGHLDEYYPKLRDDNGWLGGKGDGWEETPYWLDGALPLAYLLNDKALKDKVLRYVNWNLDHQRPNGFFGPYTKTNGPKVRWNPAPMVTTGGRAW